MFNTFSANTKTETSGNMQSEQIDQWLIEHDSPLCAVETPGGWVVWNDVLQRIVSKRAFRTQRMAWVQAFLMFQQAPASR